jgi:tagatose kinase
VFVFVQFGGDKMYNTLDAVSLGELVVEIFRKNPDEALYLPADMAGPFPSGAPAIFIDTMARLGASTGYIGTVGKDDFGRCIIDRLKKDKVDVSRIFELENATTGVAFRATFSDGSRKFIFHIGNAAPGQLTEEHIDRDYITKARWLHISGNVLAFSRSAREAVMKAADIAYSSGIPISLDPNLRLEMMKKEEIQDLLGPILKKATVFLPSMGEIRYITGMEDEDEGALELIKQGIRIVARKEGTTGSTIFTKEGRIHIEPFKIGEVDPTGCGDAFGGAFVYGLLNGWDLEAAGEFANAVGAITATRHGPMEGIESLDEVKQFIYQQKMRRSL